MNPLLAGGLIGGGLGVIKGLFDGGKEDRQKKMRAAEIMYSPWTKMGPTTEVQDSNMLGSAMQGGMAGLSIGQGIGAAQEQGEFNNNLLTLLGKQGGGQPNAWVLPTLQPPSGPLFGGR